MKKYIALLRGVNVSGKNKVPMAMLRKYFEEIGFEDVKTYLNSGNVIFTSNEESTKKLSEQIEMMIKNQFNLDIPVLVLSKEDLVDILQNVPEKRKRTSGNRNPIRERACCAGKVQQARSIF